MKGKIKKIFGSIIVFFFNFFYAFFAWEQESNKN